MFAYACEVREHEESGRFCKWIIKAVDRFFEDLKREDIYIDFDRLNKVVTLFEEVLCVPELGKPSEIYLPHAFWIEQLYGWHYKETGLRRFTEVYAQMGRKQFKTYWAGSIAIAELIIGSDLLPEIMVGANSRDQAVICTKMIGKIINASDDFGPWKEQDILRLYEYKGDTHKVLLKKDKRDGSIAAMPKNPGDGGNPSILIVDELHEAENLNLMETGKSGQGQRREPLSIVITSPGHNKHGVCYQILRKSATDNLNGIVKNDRQLPIIFELDNESDWDNVDKLEQSNPMMPYSPTLRPYLLERIEEAKSKGGSVMTNVKIKNSGIWVDAAEVWLSSEDLKQNRKGLTYDDLIGKSCYCAFDFSKGGDLCAFGAYFPELKAYRVWFWLPEETYLESSDTVDYSLWSDYIITQTGNVLDLDLVVDDAMKFVDNYHIAGIGADKWNHNNGPSQRLAKVYGFDDQASIHGGALTPAINEVEAMVIAGEFELFDNPVLWWNFSNCLKVVESTDRVKIMKADYKTTKKKKIDGAICLILAKEIYNRMNMEPEEEESKIEVW